MTTAAPGAADLALVGSEVVVPLVTGANRRFVNLDFAASTPPLARVEQAVSSIAPWYSSVHRGAGFKSQVSTAAYEHARTLVGRFVGARSDDVVVFTRNTTDAINLLAHIVPAGTRILASPIEHHANLLPWRRREVKYLPYPSSPVRVLEELERTLKASKVPSLVALTGASNVTGEVWPLREISELVHHWGGRVAVDAAQLAPHRRIDMAALDIDFLAMSGHKLYAPYGAGVLIGRPDWLAASEPFLMGGGAVQVVTLDDVVWNAPPDRLESGSPNVIGAMAMGVACDLLGAGRGMELRAAEEDRLLRRLVDRLATVPGLTTYRLWTVAPDRVGIVTFTLGDLDHSLIAAILSAEYGIGVRHGCFCAHPLLERLLKVSDADAAGYVSAARAGEHPTMPGAVRISLGIGSTEQDVDDVADALDEIARRGPRWTYTKAPGSDEFVPDPDPREFPDLPFLSAMARTGSPKQPTQPPQ